MSITATTTNPTLPTSGVVNNKALWRRVGDSVQIIYVLETGTVSGGNNGSGTYLFSLPNGLSIDTGKVPSTGTINKPLGVARLGTNRDGLIGYVPTISTNKLIVSYETSGIDLTACDNTVALMTTNNQSLMFEAQVPILGWSSSVVVSSSTDTRVVAAKYYVSSVNSPGANLPINFDTRISDTHGAVTTGSGWRFTAPVPGTYAVAIHTQQDTATNYGVRVYKNGSLHEILYYSGGGGLTASGSTLIDLVAGDYIDARPDAAGGIRGAAGPAYLSAISINRLSGPSQIAASETVAARYQVAAGVSSNSTTPVNFATRVFDSHGAVTTGASWRFSAPIAGKYSVSTVGFLASGTSNFDLYKNGSFHITLHNLNATGATSGTGLVEMISGDYIDIRTNSSVTTGSVGTAVYISIHRIGN